MKELDTIKESGNLCEACRNSARYVPRDVERREYQCSRKAEMFIQP